MSQKTVVAHVYGKEYTLACDAGQEQHLSSLVQQINARAQQLEKAVGKLPESMMLLYTALMVADELHDAKRDNAASREELSRMRRQLEEIGTGNGNSTMDDNRLLALEEEVAGSLHAIATRIEGLADKLSA